MFLLSGPQKLLAILFLVTTMLSIGTITGRAQLRSLLASRSLLVRILVANFVLVPIVGIALARFVSLPPGTAAALTLLACVPGGLTTVQYTSRVKGEAALAGAMLVLLTVLAVLVSPVILRIVLPAGVEFLPYGHIFAFIALWILTPLVVGIVLCNRAPKVAPRLAKVLGIVSLVLFIAFMVVMRNPRKEAVASLGSPAVGAMLLFIIASMVIGWLMGGPARETRQLFATVTSMRNTAICLAMARNAPSGDAVLMPLLAFSLLMVTPNTLLTLYFAILDAVRARKAAGRAGESTPGNPVRSGKNRDASGPGHAG